MKKLTAHTVAFICILSLSGCGAGASLTDSTDTFSAVESTYETGKGEVSAEGEAPAESEVSAEGEVPAESEVSAEGEVSAESALEESEASAGSESVPEIAEHSYILPEGTTVESRFAVPEGYVRTEYPEGSFGSFVRTYPLKPDGSPVLLWTKVPKGNQSDHAAVFDMTVEDELDVQQCADSVMRIYAEYFRATGQYDRIKFHFVSGFLCDYNSYTEGKRVRIDGSDVVWTQSAEPEDSDAVFNEYMKIICAYASTLSMEAESYEADIRDLQIGDIFLKGGSPGHVVMVVDVCEKDGKYAFLLAQGYMPAQEFHIIKNPLHAEDPWYYEEEVQYPFLTQAYIFPEGSFRRLTY